MTNALWSSRLPFVLAAVLGAAACNGTTVTSAPNVPDPNGGAPPPDGMAPGAPAPSAAAGKLPLVVVSDVPLPGGSTRFDYQDIDPASGHLVTAHMNDGS